MVSQNHIDIVTYEFSTQAANWWSGSVPVNLQETIARLNFAPTDSVIDVAAGSCQVSRAVAPLVASVTAGEVTAVMLHQGKEMAQREGLLNIDFRIGQTAQLKFAEVIPFATPSFMFGTRPDRF